MQTLEDLIFIAITMLLGQEGEEWDYYETDLDWWSVRLYTRRN